MNKKFVILSAVASQYALGAASPAIAAQINTTTSASTPVASKRITKNAYKTLTKEERSTAKAARRADKKSAKAERKALKRARINLPDTTGLYIGCDETFLVNIKLLQKLANLMQSRTPSATASSGPSVASGTSAALKNIASSVIDDVSNSKTFAANTNFRAEIIISHRRFLRSLALAIGYSALHYKTERIHVFNNRFLIGGEMKYGVKFFRMHALALYTSLGLSCTGHSKIKVTGPKSDIASMGDQKAIADILHKELVVDSLAILPIPILDLGLEYSCRIKSNLLLRARAGYGIFVPLSGWHVGFGISYRVLH